MCVCVFVHVCVCVCLCTCACVCVCDIIFFIITCCVQVNGSVWLLTHATILHALCMLGNLGESHQNQFLDCRAEWEEIHENE